MKKSFRTEILGQRLALTSDQNEEFLKEIAGYIEDVAGEIKKRFSAVDSMRIAVMTSVTIAEEFFSYRNHQEKLMNNLENRIGRLQERVDKVLNDTLPGA